MLTTVLRDSLGGNTKTAMIATMAAAVQQLDESVSTCRFAQRVAQVSNKVRQKHCEALPRTLGCTAAKVFHNLAWKAADHFVHQSFRTMNTEVKWRWPRIVTLSSAHQNQVAEQKGGRQQDTAGWIHLGECKSLAFF